MRKSLRIELGRTWLAGQQAAELEVGDLVELDVSADSPVDVYADGALVARGLPGAMDGKLCVRITELAGAGADYVPAERAEEAMR